MTPEERQALREKHRKFSMEYYLEFCSYCHEEDRRVDYPCDVIKVLDATENLKSSDLKTEAEPVSETDPKLCDHAEQITETTPFYAYCSKCGEKL